MALFNPEDQFHAPAASWFRDFRGQLLTTEAVVAETAYFLGSRPALLKPALLWLQRLRGVEMIKVESPGDYARVAAILEQYASLPCDYADASLIELAERTGVTVIATIDQRDFSVYRVRGRKQFRIVLGA